MEMKKPKMLVKGDRVAIVSLSSGILGELGCKHQVDLGIKRLEDFGLVPVFMKNTLKGIEYLNQHPDARAQDLKDAFFDDSIKGIICAIGGDDTYRLLPYLLGDQAFIDKVKASPKLFTGFSDSTNNHLMLYKLGMVSYYGLSFLSDIAELEDDMLLYTKEAFQSFLRNDRYRYIHSSNVWYEERTDYSENELGKPRKSHQEKKGYQVLYGQGIVTGKLLGGCLESLYDAYTGSRYPEQKVIYDQYKLMPSLDAWKHKILFIETSEECPSPDEFYTYMNELKDQGILNVISALLVGKPQNEKYYDEYKDILSKFAVELKIPTLINVNFGHGVPRNVLPYGVSTTIDFDALSICIDEKVFED